MAAPTKISASCAVVVTLRGTPLRARRGVAPALTVASASSSPSRSRSASAAAKSVAKLTGGPERGRSVFASISASAKVLSTVRSVRNASAYFSSLASFSSQLTAGDVLIQTDQNGQNTHVCIGDSVVFNFTVVKEYVARKAVFSMKRSKNSTNGCSVSIYDQRNGGGNLVTTAFIPVASFSQQWTDMVFVFDTPLHPDTDYSLVVSSTTSCNDNNDSFFIKAGAIEVVDMANGVVISNGYSIETKKPKCQATMFATATRIRNGFSSFFSQASLNSDAVRGRFVAGDCLASSSFDSSALRWRAAVAEVVSQPDFVTAARLLAAGASEISCQSKFDGELTGGIVADNIVLNYNLVQPESFSGEGSDTVYDIVMNSDLRLFPKPSIAGTDAPESIGHWDLTQGMHKRIYPNFPFYIRNRYGRKNSNNRIKQLGPYFSDFAFGTIRFNGEDSYGITLNDLSSKFNSNKVSAFMWAYPTRDGVLLSEQGSFARNEEWHTSQIEIVDGNLKFGVWSDGGLVDLISSIPIEFFHWYYLGFTYDGSVLKGYVSGVPAGSVSADRSTPYGNGYGLYYSVGGDDPTNLGDGRYGSMRFGQMHLYSDALTEEEVYFNWYNTRARFEDPEHYLNR